MLQLVMGCTLLVVQHCGHRRQPVCLTPRRGGLRIGTEITPRQAGGSREDRREGSRLVTGRRHQNKCSWRARRGETNGPW